MSEEMADNGPVDTAVLRRMAEELEISRVVGRIVARSMIAAADRLDHLERWKAEAIAVLDEWEQVWQAAGQPGQLGSSKAGSVRDAFNRMRWL